MLQDRIWKEGSSLIRYRIRLPGSGSSIPFSCKTVKAGHGHYHAKTAKVQLIGLYRIWTEILSSVLLCVLASANCVWSQCIVLVRYILKNLIYLIASAPDCLARG